jgi:hypothetical protein
LLRTLGQELDREGAHLRWLRETETGLRVAARTANGEIMHYFGHDELRTLSRKRVINREAPVPRPSVRPRWPFDRPLAA